MTELPQINTYQELFINDVPLIDVRAPIEFSQGAFPQAKNLPLMNDQERQQVGIEYKQHGQQQAIALGHRLLEGQTKQQRIDAWSEFAKSNPQGALYCFRGGLRSKISQQWLFENTGVLYPRIDGGYKALRRFLLNELDTVSDNIQPLILAGRTGCGKTLLIQQLTHKIDLEGIFRHRGSAFGKLATPQPSQIDIENTLAIAMLKLRAQQVQQVLFEDEAPNIGSRRIPHKLFRNMQQASLLVLEADIEQRIRNIFDEYITESLQSYQQQLGETSGFSTWSDNLLISLGKIQRRLGGQRYQEAVSMMHDAIQQQLKYNDIESHQQWIRYLLENYYDSMYDYQIGKKSERITYRGCREDILAYLHERAII